MKKPTDPTPDQADQADLVSRALASLKASLRDPKSGPLLDEPEMVQDYLRLRLGPLSDREMFGVLWINAAGHLVEDVRISEGSLTTAYGDTKRVLRSALEHDACAAIFYHNHPSGGSEPSDQDRQLTAKLAELLEMLEIRMLDHMIVGNSPDLPITSMREHAIALREKKEEEEREFRAEIKRNPGLALLKLLQGKMEGENSHTEVSVHHIGFDSDGNPSSSSGGDSPAHLLALLKLLSRGD